MMVAPMLHWSCLSLGILLTVSLILLPHFTHFTHAAEVALGPDPKPGNDGFSTGGKVVLMPRVAATSAGVVVGVRAYTRNTRDFTAQLYEAGGSTGTTFTLRGQLTVTPSAAGATEYTDLLLLASPPCMEVMSGYLLGFFVDEAPSSLVQRFDATNEIYQVDAPGGQALQVGESITIDTLGLPYSYSMQLVIDIGELQGDGSYKTPTCTDFYEKAAAAKAAITTEAVTPTPSQSPSPSPGGPSMVGPPGPPGPPGQDGTAGTTGPQGPQGPKGEKGSQGSQGVKGEAGQIGQNGQNGARGPPGTQGSKGDSGSNGVDGADGTKGDKGSRGPPGTSSGSTSPGVKGAKGDPGIVGPPGPPGPAGQAANSTLTNPAFGASSGAGSSTGSSGTWAFSENYVIVLLFIWQTATTLALILMCIMMACRRRKQRIHPPKLPYESFQNGGHNTDRGHHERRGYDDSKRVEKSEKEGYREGGVPIKRKRKTTEITLQAPHRAENAKYEANSTEA